MITLEEEEKQQQAVRKSGIAEAESSRSRLSTDFLKAFSGRDFTTTTTTAVNVGPRKSKARESLGNVVCLLTHTYTHTLA